MSCSNLTMWASPKSSPLPDFDSLCSRSLIAPSRLSPASPSPSSHCAPSTAVHCGLRELRERVDSVKNTQKITEAMKLVAAAKVRRAQEAVVSGRPFSETLVEVLYNINEQLQTEDIDIPLTKVRPIKKIALVVVTDDHGLRGGFNDYIIRKAESFLTDYGLGPSLPSTDDDHHLPASSNVYNSVSSFSSSSPARLPSKTLLRKTLPTSPNRNALCSTRRNPGRHQEEWRVQAGEEQHENYGIKIIKGISSKKIIIKGIIF